MEKHYRSHRQYHEQLHAHKFDNLDEMNWFFKRNNLPKLIQEEIDSPSRPVSIKEIELVSICPQRKLSAQMVLPMNSTKHLRRSNTN